MDERHPARDRFRGTSAIPVGTQLASMILGFGVGALTAAPLQDRSLAPSIVRKPLVRGTIMASMDRRTWAGIGLGTIAVAVLVLALALGIPLHVVPAMLTDGSPDLNPAESETFDHFGEGPTRFEATVENLSTCGPTCRNVTATLRNEGETPATNVSLDMHLTANGSQVWTGTRSIGRLEPGATVRWVQSADVGFGGSGTVLENDGYVTIWFEVHHAGESETLQTRLKAA